MNINIPEAISNFYSDANVQTLKFREFWGEHKQRLEKLFQISIENIAENELNNCVVLGAGNCNDINLHDIVETFSKITLVDIDNEALHRVKNQFNEPICKKINLFNTDLLGLHKNYTTKFSKSIIKRDFPKVNRVFNDLLSNNESVCSDNILPNSFNLAISSTVVSQLGLLYTGIVEHNNLVSHYKQKLLQLSKLIAEKHVKQVMGCLSEGGVALITSEQYEWGYYKNGDMAKPTGYLDSYLDLLDPRKQMLIEKNEDFVISRISDDMLKGLNIVHSDQWIWRFDERRYYFVKGWVIKK